MNPRWEDKSRNYPQCGYLENHPALRTAEQARADIERERARRAPLQYRKLVTA